MRRLAMLLTALAFALPAHLVWAQEPKQLAQEFFDKTKAGKISDAFDGLFRGSGIPETKPQAVDVLKRQTASGLPLYGSVLRSELIYEESFGTSVVRLVYVLVQEKGSYGVAVLLLQAQGKVDSRERHVQRSVSVPS
jgi:hypothetical protein